MSYIFLDLFLGYDTWSPCRRLLLVHVMPFLGVHTGHLSTSSWLQIVAQEIGVRFGACDSSNFLADTLEGSVQKCDTVQRCGGTPHLPWMCLCSPDPGGARDPGEGTLPLWGSLRTALPPSLPPWLAPGTGLPPVAL